MIDELLDLGFATWELKWPPQPCDAVKEKKSKKVILLDDVGALYQTFKVSYLGLNTVTALWRHMIEHHGAQPRHTAAPWLYIGQGMVPWRFLKIFHNVEARFQGIRFYWFDVISTKTYMTRFNTLKHLELIYKNR